MGRYYRLLPPSEHKSLFYNFDYVTFGLRRRWQIGGYSITLIRCFCNDGTVFLVRNLLCSASCNELTGGINHVLNSRSKEIYFVRCLEKGTSLNLLYPTTSTKLRVFSDIWYWSIYVTCMRMWYWKESWLTTRSNYRLYVTVTEIHEYNGSHWNFIHHVIPTQNDINDTNNVIIVRKMSPMKDIFPIKTKRTKCHQQW